MILTRFDHCFAEPETSYTHNKTCTYSCSNKVYMSDKLARQYNYNHGNAYLPPDDRLMAQLIVGHLPDVLGEPEREYDYTRVGTIGCFCEERLLRGDGDGLPGGENDTDAYPANLCQWRFVHIICTIDNIFICKCINVYIFLDELGLNYHEKLIK